MMESSWVDYRHPNSDELTVHCEVLVLRKDCMYKVAAYCAEAKLFFVDGAGYRLGNGVVAWSKINELDLSAQ